MMHTEPAITARGLTRRFGNFTAVDALELSVAPGEVFGLLGANGAGKTTTIRMLCGMLAPNAGEMSVAGVNMVQHPRRARGRIGYVSQGFALYGDLSVHENLRLQAGLYGLGRAAARRRVDWALDYLTLATQASRPARELPLGYQRRLSLACALLHEPAVLFLDEPTSGVDPLARQHFWELIYDLAENGIGILVTTHYMDEAAFCDHLAMMHAGRIVEQDAPEHLLHRPLSTPMVELEAQHCESCVPWLATWSDVREVITHAGRLRIRARTGTDVDSLLARIRAAAREHGVHITRLERVAPELEDVFVAVLERSEAEH